MNDKFLEQLRNQPIVDFGDEVPYAFDYLPENGRLNREMFERAVNRAKRALDIPSEITPNQPSS